MPPTQPRTSLGGSQHNYDAIDNYYTSVLDSIENIAERIASSEAHISADKVTNILKLVILP